MYLDVYLYILMYMNGHIKIHAKYMQDTCKIHGIPRETGMGARLHTQVSPLNRECPAGCMLLHACSCWSRWFPNLCLTESGGSTPQRPRRLPRRGAKPAANQGLQRPVGHHSVKRGSGSSKYGSPIQSGSRPAKATRQAGRLHTEAQWWAADPNHFIYYAMGCTAHNAPWRERAES